MREKGAWQGELKAKKKGGSTFDAMAWANLVTDDAGKPICLMASLADITERKQVEEELLRVNRALRAISECNQADGAGNRRTGASYRCLPYHL